MREFVVTLTHGGKVTVRADDVGDTDPQSLRLVVVDDEGEKTVALFERSRVAWIVSREHLVSEEKGEPLHPPYVVPDSDSEIPF